MGSKSGALSGFLTATLISYLILVLRLKLIHGNKIKDGCSSYSPRHTEISTCVIFVSVLHV